MAHGPHEACRSGGFAVLVWLHPGLCAILSCSILKLSTCILCMVIDLVNIDGQGRLSDKELGEDEALFRWSVGPLRVVTKLVVARSLMPRMVRHVVLCAVPAICCFSLLYLLFCVFSCCESTRYNLRGRDKKDTCICGLVERFILSSAAISGQRLSVKVRRSYSDSSLVLGEKMVRVSFWNGSPERKPTVFRRYTSFACCSCAPQC